MKALQGTRHGTPSEVIEIVELPDPTPNDDQVVVELVASPINPSDVLLIKGLYPRKIAFPMIFGTEGIGRVVQKGKDVMTVREGDLVLLPLGYPTWASKQVLPSKRLFPIQTTNINQMAMASINPPTAYLMLKNYVNLNKGDWVIQNAANSAVGRYIIQLSKSMGYKTINVVRREELIEELKEIGADAVVVDGLDLHKKVREITGDHEVKLGIDAVSGDASDRLLKCLGYKATLVVYGAMSLEPIKLNMAIAMAKDLRVRTFWLTHWLKETNPEQIEHVYSELKKMIEMKQLHARISKTYPLSEYKKAFSHADAAGKDGKVLFVGES